MVRLRGRNVFAGARNADREPQQLWSIKPK
jgi:hypothetical protein